MSHPADRRSFLTGCAAAAAGLAAGGQARGDHHLKGEQPAEAKLPFEISLAEWSLHRSLFGKTDLKITNLDFARVAREKCGIGAIEYVNQFFKDKARDDQYIDKLNNQAEQYGIDQVLIMVDGEGNLGDPDDDARRQAVENHHQWIDMASELGCRSVRVNAASSGTWARQFNLAVDGLSRLGEYGAKQKINVIVENHGGLSSNALWLASVIEAVGNPRVGTLPDFGNFRIEENKYYDPVAGVRLLMPYAKGVSAKSYKFPSDQVNVTTRPDWDMVLDYQRLLNVVWQAGYKGHVGIEYEGDGDELKGIARTKAMLERVGKKIAVGMES